MNESKHTPGPWERVGDSITTPRGTTVICDIEVHGALSESEETQDANSALIAAAPDLLRFCEWLNENGDRWRSHGIQAGPAGRDRSFFPMMGELALKLSTLKGQPCAS